MNVKMCVCVRRAMLFLQVVLEMVEQLGSSILTQPEQILSFVSHALEPTVVEEQASTKSHSKGVSVKITQGDSDDEDGDEDEGGLGGGDDVIFTALNLLLSILEGE